MLSAAAACFAGAMTKARADVRQKHFLLLRNTEVYGKQKEVFHMSKVYIFFADGLEEIEGLTVVDMMRRAGIDISIVSMNGTLTVTGSHKITIGADVLLEDIDADEADMFVLPGGLPGTNHLANSMLLADILKKAYSAGKYVAAICAAPSVLGGLGILHGKKATCYPGFEDKLTGAVCQTDNVVADGKVITSRGMGTAIEFSARLIAALKGEKAGEDLMASIMFNYKR